MSFLLHMNSVWDFVSSYLPNYYIDDESSENRALHELVSKEFEHGHLAYDLLHEKYNGDLDNPQITIDVNKSDAYIFRKAIERFIEEDKKKVNLYKLDDLLGESLSISYDGWTLLIRGDSITLTKYEFSHTCKLGNLVNLRHRDQVVYIYTDSEVYQIIFEPEDYVTIRTYSFDGTFIKDFDSFAILND